MSELPLASGLGGRSSPEDLTTPHLSPSVQSALDDATPVLPLALHLAETVHPATSALPPTNLNSSQDGEGPQTSETHLLPSEEVRPTPQNQESPREFPAPPPEDGTQVLHLSPTSDSAAAAAGAEQHEEDSPKQRTESEQEEEILMLDVLEETSALRPAESLPLVTHVIRIPAFDVASRGKWTALEKTIFDQVSCSHACTRDNHSAHKCRTAFAAAGQLFEEADIEERMATSLEAGNLTSHRELLRLAKLPEINREKLQLNCNTRWMEVVEEATRTVLAHFLQQPEAKANRRGSAHATWDHETQHQRGADHSAAAEDACDPILKQRSLLLTRHEVVVLSTPPPAREAGTKRTARKPTHEQMIDTTMYGSSSSTSSDESSSSDASPTDRKTRSGSARPSPPTQASTIASTESNSSSPDSEREQARVIIKRKSKPQQGARQLTGGSALATAAPKVALLQGGVRTKSTPTPSRLARGTAVASPLRQQTRPHEDLLKAISTVHRGCSPLDQESLNAIFRSIASILQQGVDESADTKATLERLSQTNTALTARVNQLEKLLAAAIAAAGATETTATSSQTPKSQAPLTTALLRKYVVEKVLGDGYCFFASTEKAKGWKRDEAKQRIVRFLLSKAAPADEDLPSIVSGIDGLEKVAMDDLKSAYILKLMEPGHYGGEAEATLLAMEQQGDLRIVMLQTRGAGALKRYQKEGVIPKEEMILYHSTCGYADSDGVEPNHFDLVSEVMPDGAAPRYLWTLTAEEAAATTEQATPRWTEARLACAEWNREKQRPVKPVNAPVANGGSSNKAAIQPTKPRSYVKVATAGAGQHVAAASRGSPHGQASKAPSAQQPTAKQASVLPPAAKELQGPPAVGWGTIASSQNRKVRTQSAQPLLVVKNLRRGMTEKQFYEIAAARRVDLSVVTKVDILSNVGQKSCRAVLHMQSKQQAELLQQVVRRLAPVHGQQNWKMEPYQFFGFRHNGDQQSAAPQARKLANQQLVSPAPVPLSGIRQPRGLCHRAATENACDRPGCPFDHQVGTHVRGLNAVSRKAARRGD
jgi:hypothetical protein